MVRKTYNTVGKSKKKAVQEALVLHSFHPDEDIIITTDAEGVGAVLFNKIEGK